MVYVKWVFLLTVWLLFGAFLHYTLPQYDVVRVIGTYEERQELGDWTRVFWSRPDGQSDTLVTRDVQFIQAEYVDGKKIVYRNEDTGWSWPPYFKFDTADLYTEAKDLVSPKDATQWVVVKHYGWRNQVLSIFPNAVALSPVSGPDQKPTNWISITILVLIAALFWAVYVRWLRFRRRRIDPLVEDVEDGLYAMSDEIGSRAGRLRGWFTGKKR